MLRLFRREASRPRAAPVLQREGRSARWAAAMPQADRRVRVVSLQRETADAVSVTLEPCDAGRFIHQPGQYLTHCIEIDGQTLRRAYSISAAEGERRLSCTIKAIGQVSTYINERLAVGDEYSIRGPSGDFTLDAEEQAPLVMVAAGSGITPIIHLVEAALAAQPDRSVTLIHANRREQDIIFAARLAELAARQPSLRLVQVLSRPPADWSGESGRVDAARVLDWAPPEACFYLCGPAGLMEAVSSGLRAAGVPPERLRSEQFLAAPRSTGRRPQAPQALRFRRSGETVTQQVGQSILEAGLAAGLPLEFSCTVGGCAACKLRLGEGELLQEEPHCLSDDERRDGWFLACSAYALGPLEIDA